MNTRKSWFFVALAVVLLLPVTASAHKMNIFAWVSGNKVLGEVKFSGGRRAKHIPVMVQDAANNTLYAKGETDDNGEFSFALPAAVVEKKPDLLIVADSGDGHRGDWLIKADEYAEAEAPAESAATLITSSEPSSGQEEATPATSTVETAESAETASEPSSGQMESSPTPAATATVDEQLLRKIVAEEVNKALNPVRRTLAENSEHEPTLQDILGGVGWIVGMAGLAAWMKSRWQQQS